jgi:cell wall assembly regulator SMI1
MQFGFTLPPAVRESYLIVDGQEAESAAGCSEGLFFGLTLLPLEDVLEEWRFWRDVDEDPTTGANPRLRNLMKSVPPGWVRKEYSQRGWIPLIADKAGNYIGVDLNPGEVGSVGQVIVFGREFDTKVVMWKGDGLAGWAKWLASFVEELDSGEGYEIGPGNEPSEGSEDGVGYESYFHDGNGRGQGDSGGESGTGGMRLTGEYRGWNTLEAWADRSLRRWYEHGAIPDPELPPEEKDKVKATFDVSKQGSGAEVPIPVIADVENLEATPKALGNVTNTVSRPPLPTISVTKPPAPLPVALPTPFDIVSLPSLPSVSSLAMDLEAGSLGMREISHEQETASASPFRSPQSFVGHENAAMGLASPSTIPLPKSPSLPPPWT